MVERDAKGRVKKGSKLALGNRGGGRPPSEVVALAKTHTTSAIETLRRIMEGDAAALGLPKGESVPVSERRQAATALLDRGWGRPAQSVDVRGSVGIRLEDLVDDTDPGHE